jgi:hypothetical protein
MHNKTLRALIGVAAVWWSAADAAKAQAPAGTTAAVNQPVTGTPPALSSRVLEVGTDVVQNEHVTAGPDGQAQLLFRDGSTVTVGPGSDLTIDRFVYDPASKSAQLAMTAVRGVFRLVGGRASKTEPVVIETPTSILGIRGGINFTRVAANGDTETTQAYGRDITVTSKITGETRTLARNGFTVVVRANQPIVIRRVDPGELNAMLAVLGGRAGASGGATSPPDQTAPTARTIAERNSSSPPIAFVRSTLPGGATLGAATGYASGLVASAAQTAGAGNAAAQVGVGAGLPLLPSGSYSGGFVSGLFNGGDTGGGLDFGGNAYGAFTYTRTDIGGGTVTTISEYGTNDVTLVRGIPQSLRGLLSQTRTTGTSVFLLDQIEATIKNAAVVELGGDSLIQFGRLTGGSGSFSEVFTSNDPDNPPFTTGPLSVSLANRSSHYVIGVPATMLPSAGTFTYSLLGATSPTFVDGSGAPGKFTGSLNVTFGINPALFYGAQSSNFSFAGNVSGLLVGLDATVTMPNDATYRMVTRGGLANPGAQLAVIQNPFDNFPGAIFGFATQRGGRVRRQPLRAPLRTCARLSAARQLRRGRRRLPGWAGRSSCRIALYHRQQRRAAR